MGYYGNGNGGMVGAQNITTRTQALGCWNAMEAKHLVDFDMWPTVQDPFIANVQLLLHGNAYLGRGSPIDAMGLADVQWAATTAALAGKTAEATALGPFFPGDPSFFIGSGNGYVKCSKAVGNYSIGLADFTIDFLAYPSPLSGSTNAFDMHAGVGPQVCPLMGWDSGKFYYFVNGAFKVQAFIYTTNTPYLLTYNRTASVGTLFVNGSSVGTWADTSNYVNTPIVTFGGSFTGGSNCTGSTLDEARLTIGTARNPATYFNTAAQPLLQRFPDY